MARVDLDENVLGADEPARTAAAPRPSAAPAPRRKFTMLNTDEDDRRAQDLTAAVVELAGIRPTKGMRADVVRALVAIASEDLGLQRKVAKLLVNATA